MTALSASPIQRVRDALLSAGCRRSGASNWTCPAHDDRDPSLVVSEGRDGRVLITCHGPCTTEAVVASIGLTMADLYPPKDQPRAHDDRPTIVATYPYHDERGRLLYEVVRYLPKAFRQRRPRRGGGWDWKLDDTRRVPYHLPQLLDALTAGREIWVAEGEKDVHALEQAGAVATCNPGGAGKWRPDYSQYLAGATVTIVTDRDPAGRAHAQAVHDSLEAVGCTVRIVEPAAGKDAADHLRTHTLGDFAPYNPGEPTDQPTNGDHAPADHDRADAPDRDAGSLRPFPLVDLAALAEAGIDPPTLVCGNLIYRGSLHSLAGPPDAGKSTLLYWWTIQLLVDGHRVVLLDEESGREQVTEKLLALGAEPHHLRKLAYVEFPARVWDRADTAGLAALLAEQRPALIGFDSSAAFLAQAGKDEDRAPDTTWFYKGILLPVARDHGAAVVILDHIGKDAAGTRYARGSGAKLANVDVGFMLEIIAPFTRHTSGEIRLTVTKDRRGYLHRHHTVTVGVDGGAMAVAITADDADPGPWARLSPAAKKLLHTLRSARQPLTSRQLGDAYANAYGNGLTRQTISTELNNLADASLAEWLDTGTKGEKYWSATTQEHPP